MSRGVCYSLNLTLTDFNKLWIYWVCVALCWFPSVKYIRTFDIYVGDVMIRYFSYTVLCIRWNRYVS